MGRLALVCYFKAVETLVKVVLRAEPRFPTATMIAIEIPAAIRPYSMAVAPVSAYINFRMDLSMEGTSHYAIAALTRGCSDEVEPVGKSKCSK